MLVDICKGYNGEPAEIDKQRASTKTAATEKAKSEEAEAQVQDIYPENNEELLEADDLRTTKREAKTLPCVVCRLALWPLQPSAHP